MSPSRILSVLVLAAACAPPAPSSADFDEAAVAEDARAASLALVNAMNGHDPDTILGFYALDADFTYVGCTHFMFGGDIFATIIGGYHVSNRDVRYDMAVQGVRILGPDIAVVSLKGTSSPDLALFTTRVLRRSGEGRWLVAWEHESWPGCSGPDTPHPGTAPGDSASLEPDGGS